MVDPLDISRVIEVVPYDPNWPKFYEAEAEKLAVVLGKNCVQIYHIGSTAVEGLSAKPIIDIMVVVKDLLEVDRAATHFEKLGYRVRGEYGMPFRRYFQKGDVLHTHHVHIFEEGSAEIERHLQFRDYLRDSPQVSEEYAKLKIDLARQYPTNIVAYIEGKDDFVRRITAHFPARKLRMVIARSKHEWELVLRFRKQSPPTQDAHSHILFFRSVHVVGYADIHNNSIVQISMEPGSESYQDECIAMLNRWLSHHKPR